MLTAEEAVHRCMGTFTLKVHGKIRTIRADFATYLLRIYTEINPLHNPQDWGRFCSRFIEDFKFERTLYLFQTGSDWIDKIKQALLTSTIPRLCRPDPHSVPADFHFLVPFFVFFTPRNNVFI